MGGSLAERGAGSNGGLTGATQAPGNSGRETVCREPEVESVFRISQKLPKWETI